MPLFSRAKPPASACPFKREGDKFTFQIDAKVSVTANSRDVQRRLWLLTAPIKSEDLENMKKGGSVRLLVTARHQGWVTLPGQSYSWFELAIMDGPRGTTVLSGNEYASVKIVDSKKNEAAANEQNVTSTLQGNEQGGMKSLQKNEESKENKQSKWGFSQVSPEKLAWCIEVPEENDGTYKDYEEGLSEGDLETFWLNLKPGDRLAVFGCARYTDWSCFGRKAVLTIGKVAPTSASASASAPVPAPSQDSGK